MKRSIIFILLLFISSSSYAVDPYTLTNLECANVSVRSKSKLFTQKDFKEIKTILLDALKEIGVNPHKRDCPSLRIYLEVIEEKPNYYLNTQIALREDVVTHRAESIETLARTYSNSHFIKTRDIHNDVLESVEYLSEEFVKHFENDNEE